MKKFIGYTTNGDFSVGCTGQTVYLYDKNNNELKKFKDIIYAYAPVFSPDGQLFVVKSTDGRLAAYSLATLDLINKFRFSRVDGAQDDGFCFSPDSRLFINLERQKDDLHSAISFYDTTDFSLVKQIFIGEEMMLNYIEFDIDLNCYYVLGFIRDENLIINHGFVAKFADYKIENITAITEEEYDFYSTYKHLEMLGFTEKAYQFSYTDCPLDKLRAMNCTLAKLYMQYNK